MNETVTNIDIDRGGRRAFKSFSTKSFYGAEPNPKRRSIGSKVKDVTKTPQKKFPLEFIPRLLGPTVCWKVFYRQNDAFEFAQHIAEDVHVFSFESCSDPTKPGTGQRQYIASSLPVFWHYYSQLETCHRQHYEIIPENSPCKLYFDLEFQVDSNPDRNGNKMVDTLIKYVCIWLDRVFGLTCDRSDILDLDASTPSKFSRHLIFQRSDMVFENNVTQGDFVRRIFGILLDCLWTSGEERGRTSTSVSTGSNCSSHPILCGDNSSPSSLTVGDSYDQKHFVNSSNPFFMDTSSSLKQNTCHHHHCHHRELHTKDREPLSHIQPNSLNHTKENVYKCSSNHSSCCEPLSVIDLNTPLEQSNNEVFDRTGTDDSSERMTPAREICGDSSVIPSVCVDKDYYEDEEDDELLYSLVTDEPPANNVIGRDVPLQAKTNNSVKEEIKFVWDNFNLKELQSLIVNKKDGTETLFCDLGVYTKNRNFRLYLSSKLNKDNHLQVGEGNQFSPKPGNTERNQDEEIFYASLITHVRLSPVTELLRFDTVSGSYKVPFTGTKLSRKRSQDANGFLFHDDKASLEGWGSTSPYPEIDGYITSLVSDSVCKGSIRHWNYWRDRQTLVYDIVGYRRCYNIGRHHKSNNIMYVVDVGSGVYYQKCHDPECHAVNYRSSEMQLPNHVLPGYFLDLDEDTDSNSNTNDCSLLPTRPCGNPVKIGDDIQDSSQVEIVVKKEHDVSVSDVEDENLLLMAVEDVEMLQTVGDMGI